MAGSPMSWLMRPALLRSLVLRLRLASRLLREPAVPLTVKAIALVPVAYVVFPLDFLPDFLPILGQLDDIGVVIAVVEAFLGLCPSLAVEFHRAAIEDGRPFTPMHRPDGGGDVIDAEWRRE